MGESDIFLGEASNKRLGSGPKLVYALDTNIPSSLWKQWYLFPLAVTDRNFGL